jgi:DNA-binding NarL/FixJ family response regulator
VLRLMIVDDHPVVREGLRGMLEADPGITVVGEAASGDEAVVRAGELRPDVILMDLRMPDGDGVSATSRILANRPESRVIVLTTYETDQDIVRAVEAGAAGYLLKDTSRADLLAAIVSASRGETVLSPSVATRLVTRMRAPVTESLSPREAEVLSLVARGLTNGEIGKALFISETTVKTHVTRVLQKLDLRDRAQAIVLAHQTGLFDDRSTG